MRKIRLFRPGSILKHKCTVVITGFAILLCISGAVTAFAQADLGDAAPPQRQAGISAALQSAAGNLVRSSLTIVGDTFVRHIRSGAAQTPDAAVSQAACEIFLAQVQDRYEYNRRLFSDARDFVHGQRLQPQRRLQIGAQGNGADHGCGPIALHNALLHTNPQAEYGCIANIIRHLELSGSTTFMGRVATNPAGIMDFLHDADYTESQIHYLPRSVNNTIRRSGAAIVLYQGHLPGYVHYVFISHHEHDSGGDEFRIFNWLGTHTTYYAVQSVDRWVRTGRDGARYTVLAVITIA